MFSGGLAETAPEVAPGPPDEPPPPPPAVTTEAGRCLRAAAARDDSPSRCGTTPDPADDATLRVWQIAFGLAARRRFEPEAPLAEISRAVAVAVRDHGTAAVPVLDAEMLVRDALGEPVPVGEMDPRVRTAVHLLLFASLTDQLALRDDELDALIAEAELLAGAEGRSAGAAALA